MVQTLLGDEAVDGLVGVVLKGRVGQVGEDVINTLRQILWRADPGHLAGLPLS